MISGDNSTDEMTDW